MSTLLAPFTRRGARTWLAPLALLTLLPLALPGAPARASGREHTVRGGQSMSSIARMYGVTIWSLAAANDLETDEHVRTGQVLNVPDKGAVYVNPGQTLWSVARRHQVTVEALARCNNLKPSASLRPGMRLVLPGQGSSHGSSGDSKGGSKWGKPKRPGQVQLSRVGTQTTLHVTLTDARSRVRPAVARQMAQFLRPRDSRRTKAPQRRLLALLAQTSDHFGGRKLHVVSGYRPAKGYTHHESRHVKGAALDFRIEGVPNRVLRDYLRHFDDVGVGFYPNSTFVHFDVREKNAYWIDVSGSGQKPRYLLRAARDGYDEAEHQITDTPISDLVEAAIEDMQHGEPTDEAESDDE